MQKCLICGADIKYIATSATNSIACDAQRLSFVTDNGRQVFGYLVHKCKTEKDNGKENCSK